MIVFLIKETDHSTLSLQLDAQNFELSNSDPLI